MFQQGLVVLETGLYYHVNDLMVNTHFEEDPWPCLQDSSTWPKWIESAIIGAHSHEASQQFLSPASTNQSVYIAGPNFFYRSEPGTREDLDAVRLAGVCKSMHFSAK